MVRRATIVWAASALVVVGSGIGIAASAATHPVEHTASAPVAHAGPPAAAGVARSTSTAVGNPVSSAPASIAPAEPGPVASPSVPPPGLAPSSAPRATVTPTLGYYDYSAGTLTLGAGVSGLVDTGGICTVTLRQGATAVTRSFAAVAGPSSTDCGAMTVTSAALATGTWHVVISYTSTRASGTSADEEVHL